jgi:gp16 family phage-associated protein
MRRTTYTNAHSMKHRKRLKKPEEVREDFERKGISVAAWAREHKVNKNLVYEILAGNARRRCIRGQTHRIAVLLGLKDGVIAESPSAVNA